MQKAEARPGRSGPYCAVSRATEAAERANRMVSFPNPNVHAHFRRYLKQRPPQLQLVVHSCLSLQIKNHLGNPFRKPGPCGLSENISGRRLMLPEVLG